MAKKRHRRSTHDDSKRAASMLDRAIDAIKGIIAEVATNPKSLKPGELVRMLNSTPLGEVITTHRLRGHRERAGLRIGDGKTIDLLRYAGWLQQQLDSGSGGAAPAAAPTEPSAPAGYATKKERERARNAEASKSGRDIGELPQVVDPRRRERCLGSLQLFCETYFAERFTLSWSEDHLKVIDKIERAVLEGGLFALAMPRGSGKTTLAEIASLWAALIGCRESIALIGASAAAALEMLDSLKIELETNELLAADFPEVCEPIHQIEGLANRCKGQLYRGERTRITWEKTVIVLPTIPDSRASGVIIRAVGLTGRVRGMKYTRADGKSVRPELVIVDDPQTDKSARSETMCDQREKLLGGAILGLAGPGVKISGVMPCTVVRPGDLADRMLDRQKHPEWQGERTKLLYVFPTRMDLWEKYAEIRADSLRSDGHGEQATEYYREHQLDMDSGAVVAWPERHHDDELSALQHAMNLFFDDEQAFMAEYQNEPIDPNQGKIDMLSADEICQRLNKLPRWEVPLEASTIVAFIDVQQSCLFYTVAAYADNFTGAVIDYGIWPEQRSRSFSLRQIRRTLKRETKAKSIEEAIYLGLENLVGELLDREWTAEDGSQHRISRLLVDAGWQPDTVYQFCRRSKHSALLLPSHGKFVGPATTPFSQWRRNKGDRIGPHWRIPGNSGKRAIRHVLVDVNFWKSFVHERLSVGASPGGLTLYGRKQAEHRMFAQHVAAETRERLHSEGGRTVDVWREQPSKPDNHWFDCLTGTAVAASMQGCQLLKSKGGGVPRKKKSRKRVTYLES